MPDLSKIQGHLRSTARDGNLDVEDVQGAVQAARADGKIDAAEKTELQSSLRQYSDKFEPAARRYLEDSLAAKDPKFENRVLLAPHPPGAQQRDLYYARNDVVSLQEALGKLDIPTGTDGDYGPGTVKAVKAFQQQMGVPATGSVDSSTLHLINQQLGAKGLEPLDLTPRARIRPDTVVALKHGSNTADNRAVEEGLRRLGDHFGIDELKVSADGKFDDQTEAAVKAFQHRAYLPETGIVDQTTLAALNTALGDVGLDTVKVSPPKGGAGFKGKVELHFFPGDHEMKLYVKKDGKLLDTYGMVGGRNESRDDPNNPHVDYSPSPKGKYKIVEVNPHASGAWNYSYVPYGAHLREQDGEVQFRDGAGKWKFATGPKSAFAGRNPPPLERESYLDRDGKPMKVWTLNDFGHLRGRLQSLATGNLQGHMIHSSPDQERTSNYFRDTDGLVVDPAAAAKALHYSHGCEHIHPKDMDELVAKGYIAPGTSFVIHGYDQTYQP